MFHREVGGIVLEESSNNWTNPFGSVSKFSRLSKDIWQIHFSSIHSELRSGFGDGVMGLVNTLCTFTMVLFGSL